MKLKLPVRSALEHIGALYAIIERDIGHRGADIASRGMGIF
jgi:hypothetical protein